MAASKATLEALYNMIDEIYDWKKAGEIAAQIRDFAKKVVKIDVGLLDATNIIEQKILDLGGGIAFPVDLSVNEIAAHYSAVLDDKTVFKDGDLIKVDIGVHINGAIADTAVSISLNSKDELVDATNSALDQALKQLRVGISLGEIGETINQKISEHGFVPIRNLSGHGIERYNVHVSPTVPNFNNKDKNVLKQGQVIAIEPFATNGVGLVVEGKPSFIYELIEKKPQRDMRLRRVLDYIDKNYRTLPFSARWLVREFEKNNVLLLLNNLEKQGVLRHYRQLPEKNSGMVSQSEHTVIMADKPIVIT